MLRVPRADYAWLREVRAVDSAPPTPELDALLPDSRDGSVAVPSEVYQELITGAGVLAVLERYTAASRRGGSPQSDAADTPPDARPSHSGGSVGERPRVRPAAECLLGHGSTTAHLNRLWNWNVVAQELQGLGYELSFDRRKLLVVGDAEVLKEVLREIREHLAAAGLAPHRGDAPRGGRSRDDRALSRGTLSGLHPRGGGGGGSKSGSPSLQHQHAQRKLPPLRHASSPAIPPTSPFPAMPPAMGVTANPPTGMPSSQAGRHGGTVVGGGGGNDDGSGGGDQRELARRGTPGGGAGAGASPPPPPPRDPAVEYTHLLHTASQAGRGGATGGVHDGGDAARRAPAHVNPVAHDTEALVDALWRRGQAVQSSTKIDRILGGPWATPHSGGRRDPAIAGTPAARQPQLPITHQAAVVVPAQQPYTKRLSSVGSYGQKARAARQAQATRHTEDASTDPKNDDDNDDVRQALYLDADAPDDVGTTTADGVGDETEGATALKPLGAALGRAAGPESAEALTPGSPTHGSEDADADADDTAAKPSGEEQEQEEDGERKDEGAAAGVPVAAADTPPTSGGDEDKAVEAEHAARGEEGGTGEGNVEATAADADATAAVAAYRSPFDEGSSAADGNGDGDGGEDGEDTTAGAAALPPQSTGVRGGGRGGLRGRMAEPAPPPATGEGAEAAAAARRPSAVELMMQMSGGVARHRSLSLVAQARGEDGDDLAGGGS